jgi:hypothetical protein
LAIAPHQQHHRDPIDRYFCGFPRLRNFCIREEPSARWEQETAKEILNPNGDADG